MGGTLRPAEQQGPQQTAKPRGIGEQGELATTRGPREAELQPHGTAVAAVKKATIGRLDNEMKGRDEGRAARYVATVRPTKADARFVRPDQKPKVSKVDGRDLGGEGNEPTEDQVAAGEGDEASTPKVMVTGTALETTAVATVPGFSPT